MKNSKVITPTLVFLIGVLLLSVLYYSLVYKHLKTAYDSLSISNDLLKNERIELENIINDKVAFNEKLSDLKGQIAENNVNQIINAKTFSDDINIKAKLAGISLSKITVGEPQIFMGDEENQSLLSIIGSIAFTGSYEKGIDFINNFEKSENSVYKVINLEIRESELMDLEWYLDLQLIYYGNADTVSKVSSNDNEKDSQDQKDNDDQGGNNTWAQ
ncbi:hypothetical protein [Anaerovorax odorimutans]|uniref:hypothetical protein n=1 Tax=Anaerovorax odorimutans TaxID=109327 RepID=UPI00041D59BB|nr:hypothetical protein [Anaerovorax odorimutans]